MFTHDGFPLHNAPKEGVHAIIMPMTSRRIELRVIYVPRSNTIISKGTEISTPMLELSGPTWIAPPEGEFLSSPFATGSREDDKGALAILQAMVDLGHRIGLVPSNQGDTTKELAAIRYHLEDMRKLAGVKKDAS